MKIKIKMRGNLIEIIRKIKKKHYHLQKKLKIVIMMMILTTMMFRKL